MASQLELRVEALLECDEAELVESGDLDPGEPLEDQSVERRPAPQVERLARAAARSGGSSRGRRFECALEADRIDAFE